MAIEDSYNFRRVDDDITTSGAVRRRDLAGLAADGYTLVINLLPDESEYALAGERDIVKAQGVRYVHIPVDFEQPTAADFERFTAALDAAAGQRVHIHCAANFRVSAFYARYAVNSSRWSEAEARAFVADLWDPDAHPAWSRFMAGSPPDR